MAYEVLARKCRPQQFSDVLGQEHISRTLTNAIETKRVAHAYLFVGPRGTGKTSTARILAKALNCQQGPTVTPCDICDACKEIMTSNSLDVLEIDGASNNGVDQVRGLRDNVQYAPSRGPYKIYIIDEVHMLSIAAFNALLKTLEEPPAHVKFVFATTEPQKVPATILSRCQRFDLRRIPLSAIVAHLREIATAEMVKVDEEALLAVARGADGGMRDAQSALDQLISFRGNEIVEADVLSVFGLVSWNTLEKAVDAILEGDVPSAMNIVADMDRQGKDLQRLVVELLGHFRDLLVASHSLEALKAMDFTVSQIDALKARVEKQEPGRLLRVVEILSETENRMRYALSRRTLLETSFIRCARAANVATVDELLRQVENLRQTLVDCGVAVPVMQGGRAMTGPLPIQQVAEQRPVPAPASDSAEEIGREQQYLEERWGEFVDRAGQAASLVKNYLLDARPVEITVDTVTIAFDPEFADHATRIDTTRNRRTLQKLLSQMLGRELGVSFRVLTAKELTAELPAGRAVSAAIKEQNAASHDQTEEVEGVEDSDSTKRLQRSKQEWMQEPAVQKTLELFNGDIVEIRE